MYRPAPHLNDAVQRIEEPLLEPDGSCTHIMALNLDDRDAEVGVIRCIDSREGRVHVPGFVDRSVLRIVEMDSLYAAELGPELEIEHSEAIVSGLEEFGPREFLGFEDPVLWRDPDTGRAHLYCTIPFYDAEVGGSVLYLGHASGDQLRSLRMTEPVLGPVPGEHDGAKEPAIAPPTREGHRINLVESTGHVEGTTYSVVRSVTAEAPGEPWEYRDVVLHPAESGYEWLGGHASPGPLLPDSFVDVGEGKRVGLLNGRETNRHDGDTVNFGPFTIGLMIYDYEAGEIEWLSDEPFVEDPEARTITFASAFRQIDDDRGLVYAHIDDSCIRVYEIDSEELREYLP